MIQYAQRLAVVTKLTKEMTLIVLDPNPAVASAGDAVAVHFACRGQQRVQSSAREDTTMPRGLALHSPRQDCHICPQSSSPVFSVCRIVHLPRVEACTVFLKRSQTRP